MFCFYAFSVAKVLIKSDKTEKCDEVIDFILICQRSLFIVLGI